MNLKQLLAAMAKCQGEIETLYKAVEEAEAKGDAKGVESAKSIFDAKVKEFNALEAKAEVAKAHGARAKSIALVSELSETVVPGTVHPEGPLQGTRAALHAKARDPKSEEAEQEGYFLDYIQGKSLKDGMLDALQPKSTGWKAAKVKGGVAMPTRYADMVLPERNIMGKALPLLSTGTPGNQLFRSEFSPTAQMYPAEPPAIFPRCFKIPTRSGSVLFPKLVQGAPGAEGGAEEFAEAGYVACSWTAEGAEKPGTEPKFTQAQYDTHEVSAYTELTQTLINRSPIELEGLLQTLFRAALLHKIDQAIINGDGNGKPLGILQTAGIGTVQRATAAQVNFADIIGLETAVAPQLRAGGCYCLQDGALQYIKKLKDSQNRPVFTQNMGAAPFSTLMGYDYVSNQRQPALGTAGDVIFCNPGYYICPIEQEVVIARSEHYKFREGAIAYVTFAQVGGKVSQVRAFSKLIDPA